jgi:alpha-tubulin suppressor-like RCC1 family protein
MQTGAVLCWGDNRSGELGNSSTTDSPVPVGVAGLSSGAVAVSAGDGHTCALTQAGAVECWGDNSHGQLGNSSTTDSPVPVTVEITGDVVSVSAGTYHSLAVTAAGDVKYWGDSSYGELGSYSPLVGPSPVPADVAGLSSGAAAVSTAEIHTCVVMAAGGVRCWGDNMFGELGNGTTGGSSTPVDVLGLAGTVTAVSSGENHTCVVTSLGAAQCWGDNLFGQLGNGTTVVSDVPVNVVGLGSPVVAISAGWGGVFESWSVNGGNRHTCAATTSGAIQCWGSNDSGQLGNNSTTSSPVPVDVVGFATGGAGGG